MARLTLAELDGFLEVLKKNNVSGVGLDPDGNVVRIDFVPYPMASTAAPAKQGEAQAQPGEKRESDIDLALHPPDDVRHPVEDGK